MLALSIEPTQNQNVTNLSELSMSSGIPGRSERNSDSSSFAKILSSLSKKSSDSSSVNDSLQANKAKEALKKQYSKKDVDDVGYAQQASYVKEDNSSSKNVENEKVSEDVKTEDVSEIDASEKNEAVEKKNSNFSEIIEMSVSTKTDPYALSENEILNAANFENIDLSVSDSQAELLSEEISFEELVSVEEFNMKNVNAENVSQEVIEAQNASYENPKEFLKSLENNQGENVDAELLNVNEDMVSSENAEGLSVDEMIQTNKENVFSVVDERTKKFDEVEFTSTEDVKVTVDSQTQDTMNVSYSLNAVSEQNILSNNTQSASATSSNFQQMLNNQVTSNVPDFVKAGQIVLRDNNNGTINLNLKPEALGNVKISLEVSDKLITGQITVHSKEAFEAFKENLDALKQAFQQSGFENAELSLNLSQSGNEGFLGQNGQQQSSETYMSSKTYGDYVSAGGSAENEDFGGPENYDNLSNYKVDVVA